MIEASTRHQILGEAALKVIQAYRDGLVVSFFDGQSLLIRNASWGRDIGDKFDAVIADVDENGVSRSLRFYTSEICRLIEPATGEDILRIQRP